MLRQSLDVNYSYKIKEFQQKLKDKLQDREEELKPLSRQLQGFMSLPPSVDMARMEVNAVG